MQLKNRETSKFQSYLEGEGECRQLIRDYNWAETSIGSPEDWQVSLLTSIATVLNSRFPMLLWWGEDLVQFYNDDFRISLAENGKHPGAIGQKAIDCWPETWSTIKPLIDQVLSNGDSIWNMDQLIPIQRNDALEDAYWTYSFSKVLNDSGEIAGVLVVCSETTIKVQTLKKVEDSREELAFIIEAAEVGTWDWNIETGLFICNKRIEKWFGLKVTDPSFIQHAIDIAIIEEDRARVTAAVNNALDINTGGNYEITYSVISLADHIKRIVRAKGKTVFNKDGNAIRFSGTIQDVTDEYTIQQRKDEFLSIASHELKTPLTTLKASIQVLEKIVDTASDATKVPFLIKKANNNVEKLTDIIEDLLNATKIQQGQIRLNKSWFKISELIGNCCDHLTFSNRYNLTITGNQEIVIHADKHRIEQVIINLINNAIKYASESKEIKVKIEASDNQITVSVQDYGKGISADKIPHLFDRYFRVDTTGTQFAGLGLGLYICSDIIHRHEGEIGVESTVGVGSRFWFTLPIYLAPA